MSNKYLEKVAATIKGDFTRLSDNPSIPAGPRLLAGPKGVAGKPGGLRGLVAGASKLVRRNPLTSVALAGAAGLGLGKATNKSE